MSKSILSSPELRVPRSEESPFKRFLGLKALIEQDKQLMNALRAYGSVDEHPPLPFLGSGTSNRHYSLGEINGNYLATRESYDTKERWVVEGYIGLIEQAFRAKFPTITVCGGAVIRKGRSERHIVLLEDLTQQGSRTLEWGQDGEAFSTLDGKRIYHDYDARTNSRSQKYTKSHQLIQINL